MITQAEIQTIADEIYAELSLETKLTIDLQELYVDAELYPAAAELEEMPSLVLPSRVGRETAVIVGKQEDGRYCIRVQELLFIPGASQARYLDTCWLADVELNNVDSAVRDGFLNRSCGFVGAW